MNFFYLPTNPQKHKHNFGHKIDFQYVLNNKRAATIAKNRHNQSKSSYLIMHNRAKGRTLIFGFCFPYHKMKSVTLTRWHASVNLIRQIRLKEVNE